MGKREEVEGEEERKSKGSGDRGRSSKGRRKEWERSWRGLRGEGGKKGDVWWLLREKGRRKEWERIERRMRKEEGGGKQWPMFCWVKTGMHLPCHIEQCRLPYALFIHSFSNDILRHPFLLSSLSLPKPAHILKGLHHEALWGICFF